MIYFSPNHKLLLERKKQNRKFFLTFYHSTPLWIFSCIFSLWKERNIVFYFEHSLVLVVAASSPLCFNFVLMSVLCFFVRKRRCCVIGAVIILTWESKTLAASQSIDIVQLRSLEINKNIKFSNYISWQPSFTKNTLHLSPFTLHNFMYGEMLPFEQTND